MSVEQRATAEDAPLYEWDIEVRRLDHYGQRVEARTPAKVLASTKAEVTTKVRAMFDATYDDFRKFWSHTWALKSVQEVQRVTPPGQSAENGAGQYRIVRHPTPSPSALALARTRPTIEGAVADMGDGVVIAPDGHIAAFHERHLAVIERLAARNLSPELSRSAETNPNTTTSVLPPGSTESSEGIQA